MFRLRALWVWTLVASGAAASVLAPSTVAQPLPDRAPIQGTVVDQNGKPLKGAFLSLHRQNDSGSIAFWGAETASDAGGNFAFENAEEGDYYLSAELSGYSPLLNRPLSWTRTGGITRLQLSQLVRATPRFLRPDGAPLTQTTVWLRLQSDNSVTVSRAVTDDMGQIIVPNLAAATYSLFAHSSVGYGIQSLVVKSVAALTPAVQLQSGGALRIVARDGNGVPLGGAHLLLYRAKNAQDGDVMAQDGDDDYASLAAESDRAAVITRDGDGEIQMVHLPPGRYSAQLTLPCYGAIAPRLLDVTENATATAAVGFAPRRAAKLTLDLRTKDGKPVSLREVVVRALPINADGTLARESIGGDGQEMPILRIGHRGASRSRGRQRSGAGFPLRPGRYRLFVAPRGGNGDAPQESAPRDLDVSETGTTTIITLP